MSNDLTEEKLKLRQDALKILFRELSTKNINSLENNVNRAVYECADEWCKRQVTTAGLVKYFHAYFGSRLNVGRGTQEGP